MRGFFSVELARKGAKGPATILEGEKGLFRAMADEVVLKELFNGLGEDYLIMDQYIKLHAACRHIHPAIDALLKIKRNHGLSIEDIAKVKIATYPAAVSFCGNKGFPDSPEAAKFNLPFSVAMAAFFDDASMDRYCSDSMNNSAICRLASEIQVVSDKKWAQLYPSQRGATLMLTTQEGEVVQESVDLAKGEPENPATRQDVIEKFRTNTCRMSDDAANRLLEAILEVDRREVSELTNQFDF